DWAPDWLVPGWLEEKSGRLLRTLPKNLWGAIAPIDKTAKDFTHTCASVREQPLLHALSAFLQQAYNLPVDATDFDEAVLPEFLKMKVIETEGDSIVKIHKAFSDEHRMHIHRSGAATAFAKWSLPPQKAWPGDVLPEFITSEDSKHTRGYPALTADAAGVGRQVFLSAAVAEYAHRMGLVMLFRIQQADQVKYVEKRPPLDSILQLSLSAIDSGFLTDLVDAAIYDALTNEGHLDIREPAIFADRAAEARTTLYEMLEQHSTMLTTMMEQRESIVTSLGQLTADFDALHDLDMQLAFLFRPGFLKTREVFSRYPRYLKAMQVRIQRIKNNPQTDRRKLTEVEPFQNQLSDKLLECEDIASAYDLIEFAMLLEEFRVNRFAPEIKTPVKVSAQRLEEALRNLQ
ncbi:MAG: DUF3418 domain-containing protein, partial [Pontiella sp.]|nr:DUF3418 domain-containing protein [Pontiella sp.]